MNKHSTFSFHFLIRCAVLHIRYNKINDTKSQEKVSIIKPIERPAIYSMEIRVTTFLLT